MTRSKLAALVAIIVFFGHVVVLSTGALIGILGLMSGSDTIQTVLMASPVLASTAAAAISHIMTRRRSRGRQPVEEPIVVFFCLAIPLIIVFMILCVFWLYYIQIDGFSVQYLKIFLGGLETGFGAFLGFVSKKLYGIDTYKTQDT